MFRKYPFIFYYLVQTHARSSMTQTEQDRILLEDLKANDQDAYLTLYRLYYPDLARYIIQNTGNRQDAEDMFQETLFILLQKIRTEKFTLQSELKTFLFSVQKNQWLKNYVPIKNSYPLRH